MNLVLIGYRGTGKSTVGRLLANRCKWAFVDADEELEQRAGRSIREIFAVDGEEAFRELESHVVADLLRGDEQTVALGGGAVLRAENRQAITAKANRVVWLKASAATLYRRIRGDATSQERRPNLTAGGGLKEVVHLLTVREPLYRECAEFTVDTEGKTPEQIAHEIVSLLGR
jgi:shikimate kinase